MEYDNFPQKAKQMKSLKKPNSTEIVKINVIFSNRSKRV